MKARDVLAASVSRSKVLLTATVVAALALALAAALAAAVAPVVTIEDATGVGYTTAQVKGEVNPEGQPTTWRLQVSTQADFSAEVDTVEEETTESPRAVERELTGLAAGTTYYARLQAENADGQVEDLAAPFETKAVARPTISNLVVSEVTGSSAHFSAEVDPNAPEPNDPAFDTAWHFECTPACKGLEGGTVSGAAEEVTDDATGLDPNTSYTVRLVATNAGGERKATATFDTAGAGPLVKAFAAGPVQPTAADINAEIDPQGSSTTYWFEWGTEDCSVGSCQSIPPLHEAFAGAGPYYVYVYRHLSGLQPNTTYHFRVVAKNAFGVTEGPDEQFTTAAPDPACTNQGSPGAGFLPDCRAWEMVSPPDKNGQDVIPQTDKTHVATDGNAVTFSALGAFGDPQGATFDAEYIARRTAEPGTNGWTTSGINPPGGSNVFPAVTFGQGSNIPTYVDAFTPDLSAAIYRSWRPLTDAPNAATVTNLYRIDGIGTPSPVANLLTGDYASLSPPSNWTPAGLLFDAPQFAGASTDLTHAIFESPLALTADSAPYQGFTCVFAGFGCPPRLYESDHGTLRSVARIPADPDIECDDVEGPACVTAPSSEAGISAMLQRYPGHMISADGSRVFFQVPPDADGGQLYLREGGRRTYQIGSGQIWDASRDGSEVFFSTSDQLVPQDEDSNPDLYMYEVEKPAGNRLTLISESSIEAGTFTDMIGASADGRFVYFVSVGQLVPGASPNAFTGLYAWHDGELSYVGHLLNVTEAEHNGPRTNLNFVSSMKASRLTPDGRHLLFMTQASDGFKGRGGFPGYDQANHEEIYLYDADSGRLACASCNPSGAPAKADAFLNLREGVGVSAFTSDLAHSLSDNGRFVFFNTAEALVAGDTNGKPDAYEYDARTGAVHLLSSGTNTSPSYVIDASDDGRNAFIVTREQLSGWDTDNAYDLYDARVGGGLPEPPPVPPACEGESCLQGAQASPPAALTVTGSAGPGNPARLCPKGTHRVRRHGKPLCLKNHRRHHKHQRTNTNRRAGR